MATLDERLTDLEHRLLVLERDMQVLKKGDIFKVKWDELTSTFYWSEE